MGRLDRAAPHRRGPSPLALSLSLSGSAVLPDRCPLSGVARDGENQGKNARKRVPGPAVESKCEHVTGYTHEPPKVLANSRQRVCVAVTCASPGSYDLT